MRAKWGNNGEVQANNDMVKPIKIGKKTMAGSYKPSQDVGKIWGA
jgi:hypothetical protein